MNIDGEQSPGAEWATPKGAEQLKCGLERTLPPVRRERQAELLRDLRFNKSLPALWTYLGWVCQRPVLSD